MPDHSNLKKVYDKLIADGEYNLPATYEQFEADMSDNQNLQNFYTNLRKTNKYGLPTSFLQFKNDMGFDTQVAQQQQVNITQNSVVTNSLPQSLRSWRESAMPEDVAQRFEQQDKQQRQADERARAQRVAMGNTEIGYSAQAMQKKQQEQERERQRQMHENPTHTLTDEQRRGAYPGDQGVFANPQDFSGNAQMDVNKRVAREEVEKALPRVYSPELREKAVDQYAEEYAQELGPATDWERRRKEAEAAQKQNISDQVDSMLGNVEQMRDARLQELRKTQKDNQGKRSVFDVYNVSNTPGTVQSTAANPEQEAAMNDRQLGMLSAAQRKLKSAQNTIEEAQKHANEPKWLAEFGRGLKHGLTDISTWDFGITDLANSKSIQSALEKADKGEQLTESEQALLDAVATEVIVNEYFGSDISNWYQGGNSTAVSIPFMATFMISPAMTAGRSASAAMARYITKRFANKAVRGALKGVGRVGIDAAASLGQTAMFDPIRIAADTKKRMMGDIVPTFDSEGNIKYGGHKGGLSEDEARGKAILSAWGQNASEMAGDYIPGAKQLFGSSKRVQRFMNNPFVRSIANMESRAQFHGFLPEMFEEVLNGVWDATLVGDMTLDADPQTGVFSKDNLGTTAISIGATSLTMGLLKLGGYGVSRSMLRKSDNQAAQLFGDEWAGLRESLRSDNLNDVESLANEISSSDKYSDEQKKAAIKYATLYAGLNAYAHMDKSPEQSNLDQNFDAGYEQFETPQAREELAKRYNGARETLRGMIGDETLARLDDDPLVVKAELDNDATVSDETRYALGEYVAAKAVMDGVKQRIEDDAEDIAEQQRNEAMSRVHKTDGMLHPATLKDGRNVYITDGNVVMREDGSVDPEQSDKWVIAIDANTGEVITDLNPTGNIGGIATLEEPQSVESIEHTIEHPEATAAPEQPVEEQPKGAPETFEPMMELTIKDEDGNEQQVVVTGGRARFTGKGYADDPNGKFVELYVAGSEEPRYIREDELKKMVTDYKEAEQPAAEVEQPAGPVAAVEQPEEAPVEQPVEEVPEAPDATTEQTTTPEPVQQEEVPAEQPAEEVPTAQQQYEGYVAKYGEKAGHKIEVTVADKEKTLAEKKQILDAAQAEYDEAPIGKEENAEKKLAKAQAEYDAALADKEAWDEVAAISQPIEDRRKQEEAERIAMDEAERKEQQLKDEISKIGRIGIINKIEVKPDEKKGITAMQAKAQTLKQRIAKAKEIYGDYFNDDFSVASDIHEFVSTNLPRKISWDDLHGSRGLKTELGGKMSMGVDGDMNLFRNGGARLQRNKKKDGSYVEKMIDPGLNYIANKKDVENGKAISFNEAVHQMYKSGENWPLGVDEPIYTDREIRDAVIDMFLSSKTNDDIQYYVLNSRLKSAEEAMVAAEYDAKMRERDAYIDAYGVEPEYYDAWVDYIEGQAAALNGEEYNEYYNKIYEEYDRRATEENGGIPSEGTGESGADGRSNEESVGTGEWQAPVETGTDEDVQSRDGQDSGREAEQPAAAEQPAGEVAGEIDNAKREVIQRIADKLHTNVTIVENPEEITHPNAEEQEKRRNSKGYYVPSTGEVVVVLPNNKNAEDAMATVFHETAGHKGMREIIGEERYDEFLDEVYEHMKDELKERIKRDFMDDVYASMEDKGKNPDYIRNRRKAVDEMLGSMAEKMPEEMTEKERTLWQKICDAVRKAIDKFFGDLKLPKWVRLGENEIRYMLWKSRQRLEDEGYVGVAKDVAKRHELGLDEAIPRSMGEAEDIMNDRSMGMRERMTAAAARLAENNKDDANAKNALYKAIGSNLADLRKAMGVQKEFDKATVKRVADLAKILLQGGYLDGASRSEMSRILSVVKNATGKADISGDIRKVMDIMVESQLRNAENALRDMEKVKASKVDAKGVEVQGVLDVAGQQALKTFKETRGWSEDELTEAIAIAQDKFSDKNDAVVEEAVNEYIGLQAALWYVQNIHASKVEERELKQELDDARNATDRSREYEETLLEAIQQNKVERIQAYNELSTRLGNFFRQSIENAREFKEADKERVREIQHNANSDMEGRPSDEHYQPKFADKFTNNSLVQFLFSPLSTFDQMLRLFGSKSANGEGYLYNRFMRGWVDAREKEIRGVREKYAMLDAKVKSLFGKEAKSMGELIRKIGSMPKMNVEFWDGGEMKEHTLTQGNLMYIYMVNQMLDGRMKLRKMGIDEKMVDTITRNLDPRLIELADWMQNEFLVETRNEYNETHKRMFGAPMAAIENYFPLKILANARVDKPEDLDNFELNDGISTKTGSIIKRRRNALALDIMGANALNVILDHVAQMEHWNAFAEYNRDLNTLRTYKRFRNQVKNMNTIYGSGDKLWQKFNDVAQMATGSYRPKRANLDAAAVNFAKGVTAAKVSFRIFTALKQFLSMPAYLPDARPDLWAKNLATPWKSWSWAMENLPIFEERWTSRMAGDPRLLKSELDWKGWRNNIVQMASKIGMSPNAFVDALTVSIGAKTIYESRKARYLKEGYSEEQADRKAKQDAEVAYNETQQSSEGAFLSPMQVDRSWLSVMFTVFRNSSMAYQRQLHDALRNLKRDMKKGNKAESVEFMAKQMEREGVDADKAQESAEKRYNRQIGKDILRVATFGYIMQFFWNLGAKLPYLLFGDDDDKKKEMMDDVWAQSMFGWGEGLTGGDVFSQAGKMAVQGKGNPEYLSKEMPIASDIKDVLQEIGNGKYGEVVNDMVNLAVQMGIGVNPQSITDAVLAVMDACGDDPELAKESMIAVMRILQVPQSQIKEMYFDEVGLSGDEVSNYTPEQLARRYAEYQVKRGRLIAPWTWDDKALLEKEQKKAETAIKERMEASGDKKVNEDYSKYEEQYKEFDAQFKEYKNSAEYKDASPIEKAQLLVYYRNDNADGFAEYTMFDSMDKVLDKMSKYYLDANTEKQAQTCKKAIEDYKKQMVAVLDADTDEKRNEERVKLDNIINDFYKEYGNLMPTRTQEEKLTVEMYRQIDNINKSAYMAKAAKEANQ
jgi:hypothetical protein